MTDQERIPVGVLAERASRAIAEMYTDWGPGPLPWAMAERFVLGALEMAVKQERQAVVAYLHRRAQEAIRSPLLPTESNTTAVYVASLEGESGRIQRGAHLEVTT